MDSLSDVLVPLIIIASVIVQIANKRQKHSRKREAAHEEPAPASSEWTEVFSEVFDVPVPSRTPVLREPEGEAEAFRPEKPADESYRPLRKSAPRQAGTADKTQRKRMQQPLETDAPQEEQGNALQDFDIRKAVLYAEILNPKYKEF